MAELVVRHLGLADYLPTLEAMRRFTAERLLPGEGDDVELGEIEATIMASGLARETVVVAREDRADQPIHSSCSCRTCVLMIRGWVSPLQWFRAMRIRDPWVTMRTSRPG